MSLVFLAPRSPHHLDPRYTLDLILLACSHLAHLASWLLLKHTWHTSTPGHLHLLLLWPRCPRGFFTYSLRDSLDHFLVGAKPAVGDSQGADGSLQAFQRETDRDCKTERQGERETAMETGLVSASTALCPLSLWAQRPAVPHNKARLGENTAATS